MLLPNIIGYHCNSKEKCDAFLRDDKHLVVYNDTYWLGKGMYFWDTLASASYWEAEKKRKGDEGLLIVQANILLDDLLDLTDQRIAQEIAGIWLEYCKIKEEPQSQPLGVKLDKIGTFFQKQNRFFPNVIKVHGLYPRIKPLPFLHETPAKSQYPQATNMVRSIYCVKNSNKVLNRTLVVDKNSFYGTS